MRMKIEFDMDNDVFKPFPYIEIRKILREIVDKMAQERKKDGVIIDFNGNSIGEWEIIDD